MQTSQVEHIVSQALQKKYLLEIDTQTKDGKITRTLLEPFYIDAEHHGQKTNMKLWGWCLRHNRTEERDMRYIRNVRMVHVHFDEQKL